MAAPTYTARTAWSIPALSSGKPFDTTGAVGPHSVLSVSNHGVTAYTKEGTQLWRRDLREFFGLSSGDAPFDPRVVYDPAAERFFCIAVRFKTAGANSDLLFAISKTNNPANNDDDASTGAWTTLSEDVSQSGDHFLDYPLIGFNADTVAVMGVAFSKGVVLHDHYMVYAIPKSDLTGGTPTLANLDTMEIGADPFQRDFAHPVLDLDNGSGDLTMWAWNDNESQLERNDVTLNGNYSLVTPVNIAYTNAVGPVSVSQPPGGDDDPLNNFVNSRIGTSPVRVGGHDYIVLSSDDGSGLATIVVVKIDVSDNTITAKTVISEAGLSLIYPSIAVNASGHIVVGCTSVGAGATDWASAMVIVGQDDGATMTFAAGEIVQAGQRYYFDGLDPAGRNRWGDYSATVVDPLSPTRFWTFQAWAFDNLSDDTGRKMEVTEVITTPSGVFDLFGLSMGWWSAGEATTISVKTFKLKEAQSYIDGAVQSQTYLDGPTEADSYVDGAVQTQSC